MGRGRFGRVTTARCRANNQATPHAGHAHAAGFATRYDPHTAGSAHSQPGNLGRHARCTPLGANGFPSSAPTTAVRAAAWRIVDAPVGPIRPRPERSPSTAD